MQKARKVSLLILSVLSTLQFTKAQAAYYYTPRATVWGLAGTQTQARGDVLLPLLSNCDNILYVDAQGDYARDQGNFAGIGLGARKVINNAAVIGGYLFLDRDESKNNNFFTILSPGVEAFFPSWDVRATGYFPVQRHSKSFLYFPSQFGNFSFITFSGHTQFEPLFSLNEDAGRGGDAEIGYTFHRLHNTQLHGGVYYFNYNHHAQRILTTKNVTGFEGRLEVPVNPMWALTAMGTYDNYQHGTIVGGLRFNFLGSRKLCDLRYYMIEPVPRNMAGLHTGSGIPIVNTIRQVGGEGTGPGPGPAPIPVRDNIYFYTSTGGSAFVDRQTSGTADNPLSADQFTDPVINAIGPNAFYYFNPGSYPIGGSGTNGQVNLLLGDSLFGRTVGWQAPASGAQRAQLLGGINILAGSGNNKLDSVQILNNAVNPALGTTFTALTVQNANNIFVTNSVIQATGTDNTTNGSQVIAMNLLNATNVSISAGSTIIATATENGSLGSATTTPFNLAAGVYANNSVVSISDSAISAKAAVVGDNNGLNFSTAIGGNAPFGSALLKNGSKTAAPTDANFANNTFTLTNCDISSAATVANTNNLYSIATSIGGNAGFIPGGALFSAEFNNNFFQLTNCNITTNATNGINIGINYAAGIGGNNPGGASANFKDNTFILHNCNVKSTARVNGDNTGGNNLATGIGSNNSGNTADFIHNNFRILDGSIVNATAFTGGNNRLFNYAVAIGLNAETLPAQFTQNTFTLDNSTLNATATVIGQNLTVSNSSNVATGIGINNDFVNIASFDTNIFSITNCNINVNAEVDGNTSGTNLASGIGGNSTFAGGGVNFTTNMLTLTNSQITVNTILEGDNTSQNIATGIGNAAPGSSFTFSQNTVSITGGNLVVASTMRGDTFTNSGKNGAFGINLNGDNNAVTSDNFTFGVTSIIEGTNGAGASNVAGGVGVGGTNSSASINHCNNFTVTAKSHFTSGGGQTIAIGLETFGAFSSIDISNSSGTVSTTAPGTPIATQGNVTTPGTTITTQTIPFILTPYIGAYEVKDSEQNLKNLSVTDGSIIETGQIPFELYPFG